MTGIKSKVQVYSQHKLKFKFNNFFKEKKSTVIEKILDSLTQAQY